MASPIQLKSGDLACPTHKVSLQTGLVGMYYMKKIFGYYDGLKCSKCDFGVCTEKGYKDFDEELSNIDYSTNELTGKLEFSLNKTYEGGGTNSCNVYFFPPK